MSSQDRKPYLTASVLNQSVLDACQDNLTNQLEPVIEIEAPDGVIIRVSDRNKYVGEYFYEARTNFNQIMRTIGEWLTGVIQFSEFEFELNNADGKYNNYLPGGDDFGGWIGRLVEIKVGLRDVSSTYVTLFRGRISKVGGFGRTIKSLKFRVRDDLERINQSFPNTIFSDTEFPKADDNILGKLKPVIYGDWTKNVTPGGASVPAFVVNGGDLFVNSEEIAVEIMAGTPAIFTATAHKLSANDLVALSTSGTLPAPLVSGDYYVKQIVSSSTFTLSATLGGPAINTVSSGTGSHAIKKSATVSLRNVKCVLSENANTTFDASSVYLKKGGAWYRMPSSVVVNVNTNKNAFELVQNSPSFQIGGVPWIFDRSDEFFCKVVGKPVAANAVTVAKDIFKTYSGLVDSDFDASFAYFATKNSPIESAVANIPVRVWVGEQANVVEYCTSLLTQVRLELFVSRNLKLSLSSLHFDEMEDASSYVVRNWDIEKDTFEPSIDEQNNFNRARAVYSYLPDVGDNGFTTGYFKNQNAITQSDQTITKVLVFPNLYQLNDVKMQLKEMLKIASSYREVISCGLTSRAFLLDIGSWVRMSVDIGSSKFAGVPCLLREINYEPGNLKLNVKFWSFQMIPFGTWNPGFAGIVGGDSATIIEE